MANNFAGTNQAVQDALQGACCFEQCPPLQELQDNQFLAVLYFALIEATGIDPAVQFTPTEVQTANNDAWCEYNMDILCSIPPDKLKALILSLANQVLA